MEPATTKKVSYIVVITFHWGNTVYNFICVFERAKGITNY